MKAGNLPNGISGGPCLHKSDRHGLEIHRGAHPGHAFFGEAVGHEIVPAAHGCKDRRTNEETQYKTLHLSTLAMSYNPNSGSRITSL